MITNSAVSFAARELGRFQQLRAQLEAMDDIDEQTMLDTLEGETNLSESLLALADEIMERDAQSEGLKAYIAELSARKSRVDKTASTLRAIITASMERAGLKSIPGERVTLTVRPVAPGLVVSDESQVPSEFFEPVAPKLDRKKLLEAVKSGPVAGAGLGNGGTTLSMRVR